MDKSVSNLIGVGFIALFMGLHWWRDRQNRREIQKFAKEMVLFPLGHIKNALVMLVATNAVDRDDPNFRKAIEIIDETMEKHGQPMDALPAKGADLRLVQSPPH